MREEVQFDTSSSQNGISAVKLVCATFKAEPLVEGDCVGDRAARQDGNREIV